jgi:TATA-box binding protein (TBP) (component of TFIID and TFIIIB)
MESIFNPTRYKISTITATGSISIGIALDVLFQHIPVIDDKGCVNGVVFAEYGIRKAETYHKGYSKKLSISRRNSETKKRFDNQVTIIYKCTEESSINCKIFRNGNVQMTGLRYIEQGHIVVEHIIKTVKDIYEIDNTIVSDVSMLKSSNYRIRLINCDFKVGFEIKREKLYKMMLSDYNIPCNYEPCIYPGVKIQYWWNKNETNKDGCCRCSNKCFGKGSGIGDGNCKKITIAVFQSGCIIITGGQSIEQIDEAYDFICKCLHTNMTDVVKIAVPLPEIEVKKKKVVPKKPSRRKNKSVAS